MNRSKIEYCDHTLNIITGCRHGCPYCYARAMVSRFSGDVRQNLLKGQHVEVENGCYELNEPFTDETGCQIPYPFGFEPTFHRYRMAILDKHKSGKNFFVGAMADIFGDWVPDAWLTDVFDICTQHPLNNYLFLTKNPARYKTTTLPAGGHFWYGTTITRNADLYRLDQLPNNRHAWLSIEPILEQIFFAPEDLRTIDWVVLGAETGRKKDKVVPDSKWIARIEAMADYYHIPVFMKDSLIPIVGEEGMRREYPEQLQIKAYSEKLTRRLFSECAECGKPFRRDTMVTLNAKVGRSSASRTICTMCRKCYDSWCRYHKLESHSAELFEQKEEK